MSVYLSALVPTSGLVAWYPLDNDAAGAIAITDESGNSRHLAGTGVPGAAGPITANIINGRKAVVHNDETEFWQYSGAVGMKEAWVIGKVDYPSVFPATYGGFVSGILAASAFMYVGNPATTKFLPIAGGNSFAGYYKSGTQFGDTLREAPFAYFEQLRQTNNITVTPDGIQFGRDRDFGTRLFKGQWCDAMFYSSVKTAAEITMLKMYGDLKFGLWLDNGTTLYFPDPTISLIPWARFKRLPEDWNAVTLDHTYDDEGKSFNTSTDTPPVFWEIGYTGRTKAEADVFDAFNNAARRDRTFSLIDKWGVTQTGLRIVSYQRDHEAHKSWQHSCSFVLAKYP